MLIEGVIVVVVVLLLITAPRANIFVDEVSLPVPVVVDVVVVVGSYRSKVRNTMKDLRVHNTNTSKKKPRM